MIKYLIPLFSKLTLAVVFCFGLSLSVGLAAEQTTGGKTPGKVSISPKNFPKIKFEEFFFDFGKVSQHTPLEHVFVFRNIGTGVLHIQNVKAGWGCLAALASAKEIPPGGEGKINVTFKTSKKSGEKTQTVVIATDDPENPYIRLKVRAEVEVRLEAKPDRINFGRIKKGNKPPAQYILLNGEDKDTTEILSVSSKDKHIKVEIAPPDPAGGHQTQRVKVSVLSGKEVGRFRNQITLKTNHETMGVLSANLYGEVIGNIAVIS